MITKAHYRGTSNVCVRSGLVLWLEASGLKCEIVHEYSTSCHYGVLHACQDSDQALTCLVLRKPSSQGLT